MGYRHLSDGQLEEKHVPGSTLLFWVGYQRSSKISCGRYGHADNFQDFIGCKDGCATSNYGTPIVSNENRGLFRQLINQRQYVLDKSRDFIRTIKLSIRRKISTHVRSYHSVAVFCKGRNLMPIGNREVGKAVQCYDEWPVTLFECMDCVTIRFNSDAVINWIFGHFASF